MSDSHQSFGRNRRLTNAKQYSRVMRPGAIRAGRACFTVIARPNCGEQPRLGLAIAKKHVRRAVDRNRIKRLVREAFRHHLATLPSLDIVVLARPDTVSSTQTELREALVRCWKALREHGETSKRGSKNN